MFEFVAAYHVLDRKVPAVPDRVDEDGKVDVQKGADALELAHGICREIVMRQMEHPVRIGPGSQDRGYHSYRPAQCDDHQKRKRHQTGSIEPLHKFNGAASTQTIVMRRDGDVRLAVDMNDFRRRIRAQHHQAAGIFLVAVDEGRHIENVGNRVVQVARCLRIE